MFKKLLRLPIYITGTFGLGVAIVSAFLDRLPEPLQDGLLYFGLALIAWSIIAALWHLFKTKEFSLKASFFGPRLGGTLERLVYLSQITVEDKSWTDEKILKFFLRGYNASRFKLEFRCRDGNIFYSKPKGESRKLPAPSLEFPWPHPVEPYKEFGLHLVQALPSNVVNEITATLEENELVEFFFNKLKICADIVDKKKAPILLDFGRNNWTHIHVTKKRGRFNVSKVISVHMNPIALGKPRIGKGG